MAKAPVLTDGAWGTELQARGLRAGECADAWNLTQAGSVAEVARGYVEAGSKVILTNTFRSNAISLKSAGLGDLVREVNLAGAAISRRAAGSDVQVFGSMGPVGNALAGAFDALSEQAAALKEGGVDAILIETMSGIEEARTALAAAQTTGLPVLVSFFFGDGVCPEDAARAMSDAGAVAVGANCCDLAGAVRICRRLRAAAGLPVWLKPNAGLPRTENGRMVYDVSAEDFASCVPAMARAGATFIGACCGSGPAFIAAAEGRLSHARCWHQRK